MLENLRRKSMTKTYNSIEHRISFELGYVIYENKFSIKEYKQRFSKTKAENTFQNTFAQVSKEFRLFPHSLSTIDFNMIACPSGGFIMGHKEQEDNPPRSEVIETSFLLGQTEVTQELYEAVVGTNPSDFENPQNPVENVSWEDAILFCNKLSELQGLDKCYTKNSNQEYDWLCDFSKNGYRLPREKEWEYAAKAGTENQWSGTDTKTKLKEYAVYGNSRSTKPVGSKDPNEWGFYDMIGNVWEWCWDKYEPKEGASAKRVTRGGSWGNNASVLRSAFRFVYSPGSRSLNLGFRICRTLV